MTTKEVLQTCQYFNSGLSKYEAVAPPVPLIRHNKYFAEFQIQKHNEVRSGFSFYVQIVQCRWPLHENHRPTVCLQDPLWVLGNICIRSSTENLQDAFVLPNFYAPYI